MTIESKQFPKKMQEDFSEILGRDYGPLCKFRSLSGRPTTSQVECTRLMGLLIPSVSSSHALLPKSRQRIKKTHSLYCSTKWLANNCIAHSCTSHHAHLYPQGKSLLIFDSSIREVFRVINHMEHFDSFFLIEFSFLYFWELFSHLCKINKTINPGLKDNTRNLAVIK